MFFPEVGEQPKFSQIYIYDTENETNNRIRWNSHLNRNILVTEYVASRQSICKMFQTYN